MSEPGEVKFVPPQKEDDSAKIAKILALNIEQYPEFRQNSAFAWQRDGARYALHSVQDAIRRSYLTIGDFRHVIDFGAGGGGPTFLLDQICKIAGGNVEALENNPQQLNAFKAVVPLVPVYTGNGLEELQGRTESTTLITAFSFGPDYAGDFFPKLADAASKALTPEGKLLVFSDKQSEEKIFTWINSSVIGENNVMVVPAQNRGDTYRFIPRTAIISQQGLSLVKI